MCKKILQRPTILQKSKKKKNETNSTFLFFICSGRHLTTRMLGTMVFNVVFVVILGFTSASWKTGTVVVVIVKIVTTVVEMLFPLAWTLCTATIFLVPVFVLHCGFVHSILAEYALNTSEKCLAVCFCRADNVNCTDNAFGPHQLPNVQIVH